MILALLLAVVALLFLGLLVAQVGSAAEQKTQTRTVADSAAVAAAHEVRDAEIVVSAHQIPHAWATPIFAPIPPIPLTLQSTGCVAAQRNWSSNRHRSSLSCGSDLAVYATGDGAGARVLTPPGEVASGPADASGVRIAASARARVVLDNCPRLDAVPGALARWIADATSAGLGAGSSCFTPADETVLDVLDDYPWTAPAAVGPPNLLLDAVRAQFRVEIVE